MSNSVDSQLEVISKNLRRIMQQRDLSQRDIANIAGVSNSSVSKWLSCANGPSMGAIQKIADHLGILKSDILEDRSIAPKNKVRFVMDKLPKATDEQLDEISRYIDFILNEGE